MQALVTGATGFLGSNVVKRLNERGIFPRMLVRPTSNRRNLEALQGEIIEGDLLDYASVVRALQGCEQLYHIAGFVSPRPSQRKQLYGPPRFSWMRPLRWEFGESCIWEALRPLV